MALKKRRPTTASNRHTELSERGGLSKKKPEGRLLKRQTNRAGRNAHGRITVRHRGGGSRQHYRQIDFKRDKIGIPATVAALEYDPNRSAHLALLHYADGDKRYILAPLGLEVGATVVSGPTAEPTAGNALPLGKIPIGMSIHNIALKVGSGGQIVRSAGTAAQLMSRDGVRATLRLPSGEIRTVDERCYATIGQVGHIEHESQSLGKAGRARWLGRRPTVRGVAMNPVDHPMGGGEGRTSGGGHPVSPWGQLAKGKRTRSKKKASSQFIVQRRRK
ncbi:MAG: 50S ribosomal protein L2 [Candidatus Marinimicrobia bacterium]|nr:50S ribosomal protein L2 [Candidatus Neomarinimicrobiota bacterium]